MALAIAARPKRSIRSPAPELRALCNQALDCQALTLRLVEYLPAVAVTIHYANLRDAQVQMQRNAEAMLREAEGKVAA